MLRKRVLSVLSALALMLTFAANSFAEDTMSLQGKPAPDVSLKTIDGKDVKLSSEKGNVVLLDYWATWCPPCREGLPHINELANDKDLAAKGLKVWAINSKEGEAKVKPFLKKMSLTMTVPMDTKGEFGKNYLVQGIPTTVVVGRDGTIKKVFIGFGEGQGEQIKAAVEEALKEPAPTKPA
ncbi:hypothetical protein BH09PLA1_BH09PLA1_01280 [soil metagenome]